MNYQEAVPPGVYAIYYVNTAIYVGATKHPNRRMNTHFSTITTCNNIGKVNKLHSYYGYKKEDFTFKVIEKCDVDKLLEKEVYWRGKLKTKANYERLFPEISKETTVGLIERLKLTTKNVKTWKNPNQR